jgi:hypothetical protein
MQQVAKMKIWELFTLSIIFQTKIYIHYDLHNIFCTQVQLILLEEERLPNMPQKMFQLTELVIQSSRICLMGFCRF